MIINVYKPKGWTSNDVVQKIKHSCGFKKVGHAGTLDPLAEGVLLVLTDEDTKKQQEIMSLPKEYMFSMALGVQSVSHDLGSPLINGDLNTAQKVTKEMMMQVLSKYRGVFYQQVPAYSAVKKNGKKMYELARVNKVEELPIKSVEVYDSKILGFIKEEKIEGYLCPVFKIKVKCSKGFYVRSLIRDLGMVLGCQAVVTELIRTKIGHYSIDQSLSIGQIILSRIKNNDSNFR